ncbi:MAG TPA: hypothetical protein VM889_11760 [Candidatus Thermoplasmatota archaeon]|nr:hypothetical protein [Candidatus Thermoplasmatota archaeon]
MVRVLDLGVRRLTVAEALPYAQGESLRLARAVAEVEPATIALDLSLADLLRVREALADKHARNRGFVDEVLLEARRERFPCEEVHPFLETVRYARARDVTVVPLLEDAKEPGPFTRRRLAGEIRHFLEAADAQSKDPREFARAFDDALRGVPRFASDSAAVEADAARRLADLLFKAQSPRLVAVLSYPRSERLLAKLMTLRPKTLNEPAVEEVAAIDSRPRRSEVPP